LRILQRTQILHQPIFLNSTSVQNASSDVVDIPIVLKGSSESAFLLAELSYQLAVVLRPEFLLENSFNNLDVVVYEVKFEYFGLPSSILWFILLHEFKTDRCHLL